MTLAGSSISISLSLIAPLVNRSSDSGSCWHQMVAIAVCVPEQQVASTKVRVKPQKSIGNKITWNIVEAVLANFWQTQILHLNDSKLAVHVFE